MYFIVLQAILLFFITFHDWVHLPPLLDMREMEKHSTKKGRAINSFIFFLFIAVPLSLTWVYQPNYPFWVKIVLVSVYGVLTTGTVMSWWVPYFFGSSDEHKKNYIEYENTHHFLPPLGNNIVPNTFHVILHLQIWTCFIISLSLFL